MSAGRTNHRGEGMEIRALLRVHAFLLLASLVILLGHPPSAAAGPIGTVTFLAADITGLTEGIAITDGTVGSITDGNPNDTASDFTATIRLGRRHNNGWHDHGVQRLFQHYWYAQLCRRGQVFDPSACHLSRRYVYADRLRNRGRRAAHTDFHHTPHFFHPRHSAEQPVFSFVQRWESVRSCFGFHCNHRLG